MRRLIAILLFCSLLLAASALAEQPSPANRARLDRTIRYLQDAQNLDGGFGGALGKESGQGFSAWVALALAAAGINPQDQAKPGGVDAYGFLISHFQRGLEEEIPYPSIPSTAFERELMVVNAAGTDPHSFAGHDLVAELLERQRPDGSFPYVPGGRGEINDTIFAILALAPIKEPPAGTAVQRAADWLVAAQDDHGGWSFEVRGGRTEVDMTAAAIEALSAAGRDGGGAEQSALRYLGEAQNPDGGFPEFPGESESNVASTAWAVQAIWAAGQDPETWIEAGHEPLAYMASLQQPDGHIRWKQSQDLNGIWMTAYVAPAFAGLAWPIPVAPRAVRQASAPQPGEGGGSQSGRGVIAGGGGRGAPLFSRPKPQSRGEMPGGVRAVRSHRSGERDDGEAAGGKDRERLDFAARPQTRRVGGRGQPNHGHQVTGTLVGGGAAGLAAPGLHGAGEADQGASWQAVAIVAVALLFALAGTQIERRRGRAFA